MQKNQQTVFFLLPLFLIHIHYAVAWHNLVSFSIYLSWAEFWVFQR